ncbi:MAG: type II toxin-antitoxin system VapB family antitoxin [Actinomycetales bacterium]|jgi:antitoxin VapB
MSMNIKSPQAHALARELAALEHTTVTDAVTLSLKESLARRRAETVAAARLARMRAVSERFAELEREDPGPKSLWEINEDLYDDVGLPK